MPSLVTSIIGGIQGASASHHAAEKLQKGYTEAGETVTGAVKQVNPEILATAAQAGKDVTGAAETAGAGVTGAAGDLMKLLQPYISGGGAAMTNLTEGMAPGGSLTQPFTASMMAQYSPAFQFQLQQGQQAAQRAAAAGGLTGAGGTMRSLNRYAQEYAGTGFERAANLYNTQQQAQFNRLQTLANMGQTAATTGGTAGMAAAEYAGNAGMRGTEWAGGADINARNTAASNTLAGAGYLANTQVDAQKALAQGDLGAASQWNNMLGGIGAAGNTIAMAGFPAAGGGGWNIGNIGKNLGSIWSGGQPSGRSAGGYWAPGYGPGRVQSVDELGG
jgi:hypothetical protein